MTDLELIIKHLNKVNELLPELQSLLISKTDRTVLQEILLRLQNKQCKLEEVEKVNMSDWDTPVDPFNRRRSNMRELP